MTTQQNRRLPLYKFYPTLLDAYQWYLISEREDAAQDLINKINRVPITDSDSLTRIAKGTAINNLVDRAIKNPEILFTDSGLINETVGGLLFCFPCQLIHDIAFRLHYSAQQMFIQSEFDCNGINILLYGYVDYIREDRCIDLKSTKAYELGKYRDSMQKHLYPLILDLNGSPVKDFEFIVTDFENIYSEVYPVDLRESAAIIKQSCEGLINFIGVNKSLITDTKIFGGEK